MSSLDFQDFCALTWSLRFAHTDYALVHSLMEAQPLRWIMIMYDVWCQYQVKLAKRWHKWFPKFDWIIPRLRGAIPKMHIRNHTAKCQSVWSLNYIRFSGKTYGEMIEGGWAEQNQSAGSTKEHNEGHHHNSLDDVFGAWNWFKLTHLGMPSALPSKLSDIYIRFDIEAVICRLRKTAQEGRGRI